MKILQVHSKYKKRGGEETVVEEEKNILEVNGHTVIQYLRDNAETDHYSKVEMVKLSLSQRKNRKAIKELTELIDREQPEICHVHNIYPLISPAIYVLFRERKIPVIQTLHNYKMLCTNSLLFREGEVCELCLEKSLYNSIKYRCYKDSFFATTVQADAIQYHRRKGTWQHDIDTYVCLTEFQRKKMVIGGLPEEKIVVKPNFLSRVERPVMYEDFYLFAGRIDYSKGLADLLDVIAVCPESRFVLIGAADNPDMFTDFDNVDFLGPQNRETVLDYMSRCRAVLFPSKYYEGMPMVILEAFSLKKGVVASNVGAMSSMIRHMDNGIRYETVQGLVEGIEILNNSKGLAERLGLSAYQDFESEYSVKQGYLNLMSLYNDAIKEKDGI